MIINKPKQEGVTLVEVLLVMVIGAMILFLSIQQYQVFREDADVQQVKANVQTLFQAMSQFYSANCNGQTAVSTTGSTYTFTAGNLNPNYSTAPSNPYPINIATVLQQKGFLSQPVPFSPIVNSSGASTSSLNGYVAQFNQSTTTQPRYVCMTGTNATGLTAATGCTKTAQVGTTVIWKAQIAVLLQDTANAQQYLNLLQGDCLSSLKGNIVQPCSANAPGDYVVWERLPSFSTPNAQSDYWEMYPMLYEFNQQYSTYSSIYLSGTGGKAVNQTQYFLCGG